MVYYFQISIHFLGFLTHRGEVHLSEFKPLMLASLRSLVPKGWDSHHEAAWASW